jgi:hypothetical protein
MADELNTDLYEALKEISSELYMIANDLVETNQKLHVIVTRLSSQKTQPLQNPPKSPESEK